MRLWQRSISANWEQTVGSIVSKRIAASCFDVSVSEVPLLDDDEGAVVRNVLILFDYACSWIADSHSW